MSEFSQLVLTKDGINLQSKVQTGELLKFTRVAAGDGVLDDGKKLNSLTNLISFKASYPINNIENKGDGTSVVKTIISNKNLDQGFFLREVGLYAEDPDKGEILYCVTNTGEYADFIPPKTLNSVDIILDIITVVGNAENVVIEVDDSLVYVTREEFDKVKGVGHTNENVKENADKILSLAVEVSILKNAALNNFTNNIFMVNFEKIDADEEVFGVWDRVNRRLVI